MISALVLSISPCLFGMGLSILSAQFFVLGLFSSSEALAVTLLSTQIFFEFWRGFSFVFLSLKVLFLSDEHCLPSICVVSNVSFSSMSGRIELAFAKVSSKIHRSLPLMTLF